MTPTRSEIWAASQTLKALSDAVRGLEPDEALRAAISHAVDRSHYTPDEEIQLFTWFARVLTVRAALLETIGDLSLRLEAKLATISDRDEWRCFVLGFAAACLLVRVDRLLVEDTAQDSLTQRKLNEGCERLRIPRKQFTVIFKSLADPENALRMKRAMDVAASGHEKIKELEADEMVGFLVRKWAWLEEPLDPSKTRYFKLLANYRSHSARRRGVRAIQEAAFTLMEWAGRTVSEIRMDRDKSVHQNMREALSRILQPGDVLATRHHYALSNLFLPGYWPHAALYLGPGEEKARLGLKDREETDHWRDSLQVLEALKDGVRLRPLAQTLSVDAVAVVRPKLSRTEIGKAIERALEHEGKLYNFDFDFFRSDRLVCTEVVYRAYEGIGPMHMQLRRRSGRPTLSTEDILDLAIEGELFEPIAVFGAENCKNRLVTGPEARAILEGSYASERE